MGESDYRPAGERVESVQKWPQKWWGNLCRKVQGGESYAGQTCSNGKLCLVE